MNDFKQYLPLLKSVLEDNNNIMLNVMLSGSHLYGWTNEDSDMDFRGFHIHKTSDFFKLEKPDSVVELMQDDVDYVSFEIEKTIKLILKNNGNVLEQVFAKQIYASNDFNTLRKLARKTISKKICYHYKGMAENNYNKFIKTKKKSYKTRTVKKYLYVIRALMIGIHVLNTGRLIPNITELNKKMKKPYVNDLIRLKKKGKEWENKLNKEKSEKIEEFIKKLFSEIDNSYKKSGLPEKPNNRESFERFLIKIRKKHL